MKKKNKGFLKLLSLFSIIMGVCITTVGYAAKNSNLNISGEAVVKVEHAIFIEDLNLDSTESGAYEVYNSSFNTKSINYHINLPTAESSIIYKVDIKNTVIRDYGIALLEGLPENLTYEFINYNLGDKLCTNVVCNNGSTDEVYLKIKYKENGYDSNNTSYSGYISFDFEFFYNVIYRGVANSESLKQTILKNTTYRETIIVPDDNKLVIRMNGVVLIKNSNYTYDENTNELVIPRTSGNIVIAIEESGTEFDLSNTGNNRPFIFTDTGFDNETKTFFLEADFSNISLAETFENIISIGNDINTWEVSYGKYRGVNMHIYYPAFVNTTSMEIDLTYLDDNNQRHKAKLQKNVDFSYTNLFRLAFNINGIYLNGHRIIDRDGLGPGVTSTDLANNPNFVETFLEYWDNNEMRVDIGSTEGTKRSNAVYNQIKIYDTVFNSSQLEEITTIMTEEAPVMDDISYTSVSSVQVNGINNYQPIPLSYPFVPNNNKFLFVTPNFYNLNSNSLYLEMDVSTLSQSAKLENIISLGNEFSGWIGNNSYNFHVFYPYTAGSNTLSIALLNGNTYNAQYRSDITLIDGSIIKMLLSKNGFYVNGEKWIDPSGFIKDNTTVFGNNGRNANTIVTKFFDKFTFPNDDNIDFKIGSEQGSTRSNAIYNDVRIYRGNLNDEMSISLTS